MPSINRAVLVLVCILVLPVPGSAQTRVTATGSGSVTVSGSMNIFGSDEGSADLFFNAGQKTWNVDGPGWALDVFSAEVDPAGSTFVYRSPTGATTTSNFPFNNLTIAPASGSGVFGVDLGCDDFCGLSLGSFPLTIKDGFDATIATRRPLVVRVSSPELRSTAFGGPFAVTDPLKIGVYSENISFVRSDVVRYDPEQGEAVLYFFSEYNSGWRNLFLGFGPDAPESSPFLWVNNGYDPDTDGVWYLEEDMGATTTARNAVYTDPEASEPYYGPSGTYVGMTSANTIDGIVGRGALFQGTDDRIDLAQDMIRNLKAFDMTPLGAISMWFRTTADGPLFGYQNTTFGGSPSEFVPILYVGTDGKLRGQVWQGTVNPITTTGAVNDGQWHHVMLTWNSGSQSMYLDGREVGSLSGTVSHLGMSYNQVGAAYFNDGWPSGWSGTRYFNGVIDELRISANEYVDLDAFREYRTGVERDLVTVSSVNSFQGLHVKGNLTVGGGGGNPTLAFDLAGGGEGGVEWSVPLRVDGDVSVNSGASLNLAKQTVQPGEGFDYVYPNVSIFGGSLINNGTVDAVNSEVAISPIGDSVTIGGTSNTSFGTTTINAPGKTVQFKADSTGNFTQFARAIFAGLPGLPLTLQSTSQGTKWNLNLGSLTGSSISHVAIRDGGCHAGTQRFPTNERVINLGNSDDCWGFTVRGTGSTVTGGGGTPQTGGGAFGGGTNIALNMPAVPSSDEGGGNVASNITDGNYSTRWSSAGGGYPHSIYVDLGQRYSLNSARITWEAAYPASYQIEVSDNASSWTSIASVTGKSSSATDTFNNLSGTGRYVRILGTQIAVFGNMSLFELELSGTPAGGGGGAQGGGGSGGGGGAAP